MGVWADEDAVLRDKAGENAVQAVGESISTAELDALIRERLLSARATFERLRIEYRADFDDIRRAAEVVLQSQNATVESLSTVMSVDHSRAVILLNKLEELHVVAERGGLPWRTVLVGPEAAWIFSDEEPPFGG